MDKTTTKIADLPDNITIQSIDGGKNANTNGFQPTYNNPTNLLSYSAPPPPPVITSQLQQHQQQQQQQLQQQQDLQIQQVQNSMLQEQQNMKKHYEQEQQSMQQHYEQQIQKQNEQLLQMQQDLSKLKQQRLPSRDFPMNTSDYTQDEEITANYIPKSIINGDFVREKEMFNEKKLKEHEENKKNMSTLDTIVNEFQTPIFIILLFFVFQMPVVNTMIFKKFAFLSITNEDGNFNTTGLICKSILFGTLFYIAFKFVKYIVDI